ncbi:MAG TPA: carboxypeptidase regulatory-like domain-containing protein [Longimicrobiaceae bacterium]|nr:carboxypeptidase regulatory-like domain-containing protein [Longimicrobiaceae bacterium]
MLGAVPVAAQTGHILGQVFGDEGKPVAGAAVEMIGGDVLRRVQADREGLFSLIAVPVGDYTLIATQVGYNPSPPVDVRVLAGQTQRVTLTMTLAPVAIEGIEVVSTPITISTTDTDFSTEISEIEIDLLPVSYNPNDMIALTPGVRPGHVWGGATNQANNYQLDGIAANHPGLGGDLIQPSINWIESIEVKGLGAGAEYGNFQGGLVNVITKTGSNDFQGALHTSLESSALNGSNLVPTEIGSEIDSRYNLELEVRGPVIRDHLFYFLAGQRIMRDAQYINHLPDVDSRYSTVLGERTEAKYFGKLTWLPGSKDLLEASFGHMANTEEQFGNTGYESSEATLSLDEPTTFYNISWQRQWNDNNTLDAKFASYSLAKRRTPYAGDDVPGILTYGILPPNLAYQNAPLRFRSEAASRSGSLKWTTEFSTWGWQHSIVFGGEHSAGTFIDQRLRNGGMTWRPPRRRALVADDPSTWLFSSSAFIPVTWGGEVNLDSEVTNSALFLQTNFSLGPRLNVSPGLRWGSWTGRLTPPSGTTFTAVQDEAYDPRIGISLDITGTESFVAKAHWGRYHQSMIGQFFDRAEGGEVFTNEELWYYHGPQFSDPRLRFTTEERNALAGTGVFTFENEVILNETGPVVDYRQPYVDQWVLGVEKTLGSSVKIEAVYVNRRNRDMVALVDRNRATNYTLYEYVRVYDASGQALNFSGGTVQLRELYLPNSVLLERLRFIAECGTDCGVSVPHGLTMADTLNLTWDPDYALTTAPGATRKFDQIQLSAEFSRPTWGANASLVWTDLRGNLDNVTGYDDPSGYGAGPYVRVNEGTNAFGKLSNYSERVFKVSLHGKLGWGVSGGLFYTAAQGDHYSPTFTLSGSGLYNYRAMDGTLIDYRLFGPLERHEVFIGPRGLPQNQHRKLLDVHLEREMQVLGGAVILSLDIFNLLNTKTVTELNTSVNYGQNFYHFLPGDPTSVLPVTDPNEFYKAPLGRVPPRTLRLGTVIRF